MKIAFHASEKPRAQKALEELKSHYKSVAPQDADALVVLGGDGTMLRALHAHLDLNIPFFGLNLGTLGFLLNSYRPNALQKRIESAARFTIRPLHMVATDKHGGLHEAVAFNEVAVLREMHNSAKIRVHVNGTVRLEELVCDGVLISTAMGSTAYNSSAGGPILPLEANVLPITPISPFRPRRWHGALVPDSSVIRLEILRAVERPVSATADAMEVRDVVNVDIYQSKIVEKTLLFDPDNPLAERIFNEQFAPEN
jgi:NAD+ kinase